MTTGKLCPQCTHFFAVLVRSGVILPTDPPKYRLQWWCRCGYREEAGIEKGIHTYHKRTEWEKMNAPRLG
jgi:hypothetical protein